MRRLLFLEPCSQVEIYLTLEEFLIKWSLSGNVPYIGSCVSLSGSNIHTGAKWFGGLVGTAVP